jgi:hypothetical protein
VLVAFPGLSDRLVLGYERALDRQSLDRQSRDRA